MTYGDEQAEARRLRSILKEGEVMTEPVAPPVDLAERDRLLEDIKERDAQTGPVVPWGSKYDHSRIAHRSYHRDSYELAAGDRHYLLGLLRAALQAERPTK
jgi:hypothetical protein